MLSQFEAMILIDSKVMLQSKFANLPFIMALRDAGASKKSYCNLKKTLVYSRELEFSSPFMEQWTLEAFKKTLK